MNDQDRFIASLSGNVFKFRINDHLEDIFYGRASANDKHTDTMIELYVNCLYLSGVAIDPKINVMQLIEEYDVEIVARSRGTGS
jgi:hypothetical protein